jgi:hypothetical protein
VSRAMIVECRRETIFMGLTKVLGGYTNELLVKRIPKRKIVLHTDILSRVSISLESPVV